MKILILNWRDIKHPLAGGAEISTHEHAKGWVKAGHDVTLFTSSFPGAKEKEIIDGITAIRRGSHYTVHFFAFLYYLSQGKKFDMVVDEFHFIPFFTPLYVRKKKLAFIHETAEEVWFKNKTFPLNVIGFILEPFSFLFYGHIPFMTVSESTKRDLMRFRIPQQNIHVVNNGVTRISTNVRRGAYPIVMYLGRISDDKGIGDAIDAFAFVQKRHTNAELWIVGKEERKGQIQELKQKLKDLNIARSVEFFGFVTDKKKFDLLAQAWILLHPSIKEGWGLTVIEAASVGTPTVAYKTAGLSDSIQHEKTGILVSEKNPQKLALAVSVLCTNKKLYEKMSSSARVWSKQFNWGKSISQSLKLIHSLV
ncbi:MAG: glycosyl transferase family protein [uncultured bacterium]|uniref:Glycosyl transferase family 1 domain-containing protein n=1 Tax=Candidatus Gottesmanbacteria bacterium RIFCSPLOWO2_01_FULL_43_11b TaxID=1798392 RepID=A0A1F6AJ62_9BACT|nr:MAG: glycosyl transferase family protein [uncultured bacterium]OGG24473.1 MAG: hypothetical protein A3A79_04795 [Candidatus Gottesmanbacteria bacterium RIFCSPLOWO2_01_FULL_43_11b]